MPLLHTGDERPVILVVTSFGILASGFQAVGQAVKGMLRNGLDVVLLTSRPGGMQDEVDYTAFFHPYESRLTVVRFSPLFRGIWRLISGPSKRILHLFRRETKRLGGRKHAASAKHVVAYAEGSALLDFIQWVSFTLTAPVHVFRAARRHKAQVVYAYGKGVVAACMVARILSIPLCTRFFGTFLFPALKSKAFLLKYPHRSLALACPANLKIMTNDGTHGDAVLRMLGTPESRIRFWINGVDSPRESRQQPAPSLRSRYRLDVNARLVLTVSRLEQLKRVDRAIASMPMVLMSEPNAVLVIVGDGGDEGRLRELAESLSVADAVRFIGQVPHSDVHTFLLECDVFLSLYEHTNLCNPLLEALICGAAIVTIDDSSTDSLLEDGKSAILVSRETLPNSVAEAIVELLGDENKRVRLKDGAKSAAAKLQTWEQRVDMEMRELLELAQREESRS